MLRRIIWLILIVLIAYTIYRRIDPVWAATLQERFLWLFQSDPIVQTEIIQEETDDVSDNTQPPVVYTGTIDSASLVELDYILSQPPTEDEPEDESNQIDEPSTELDPTPEEQVPDPKPKVTQPSTDTQVQPELSAQDNQDVKDLLNAIVE